MYRLILFSFLVHFTSFQSNAQVEINKKTSKKEKVKKENGETTTTVFVMGNWSHATRKLIENEGLFGDSLGDRAQEVGIGTWSFGIGMWNQLNKSLAWEGGISYFTNGEFNDIETEDTSYNYTTKYSYVGMPIKLHYTVGDKVKVFAAAGLIPQMFLKYKQNRRWLEGEDAKSEDVEFTSGFNPFVLSAVFNIGVRAKLSETVGIALIPEYRMQLTSSYEKNDSYKHFARALGFNFGVTIDL